MSWMQMSPPRRHRVVRREVPWEGGRHRGIQRSPPRWRRVIRRETPWEAGRHRRNFRSESSGEGGGANDDDADGAESALLEPPASVIPTRTGIFTHNAGDELCDACEEIYYSVTEEGDAWALVMRLEGNDFCFGSTAWLNGRNINSHVLLGPKGHSHVRGKKPVLGDAKNFAFHRLQGVKELRFENVLSERRVDVTFSSSATPEKLMTTNEQPIDAYPSFDQWLAVFAPDVRNYKWAHAPVLMRSGNPVLEPRPPCRTSGVLQMVGCVKPCILCFYAGIGSACPAAGKGDDQATIGIGHSRDSCGAEAASCSASTKKDFATGKRILVWAKVEKEILDEFEQAALSTDSYNQRPLGVGNSTDREYLTPRAPSRTGVFEHQARNKMCDGCGKVYYKFMGSAALALVMKLHAGGFCYEDPKWNDERPYKQELLLDDTMSNVSDAKSLAFHKLNGVQEIILETQRGGMAKVTFTNASTPHDLIVQRAIPFERYPDWAEWTKAFGSRVFRAPMFVRGGEPALYPDPPCRTSNVKIQGCGGPCVFCFMASRGFACPGSGAGDDLPSGIGLSAHTSRSNSDCDVPVSSCSASSNNTGHNQVLVWAKVAKPWLAKFGQVADIGAPMHFTDTEETNDLPLLPVLKPMKDVSMQGDGKIP